ncbi:hypothetical protein ADS79_16895 [Brevibacillus reuszeri]|uniref:Uncharacterized protein n=1 Tax=Brevibacillus reuszeri TaxID=54915 RepID=A0A0K9YPD7_9BACL|nr:hypothetical protein ADS79_16895 [Brevibacillus reuszeri]
MILFFIGRIVTLFFSLRKYILFIPSIGLDVSYFLSCKKGNFLVALFYFVKKVVELDISEDVSQPAISQ